MSTDSPHRPTSRPASRAALLLLPLVLVTGCGAGASSGADDATSARGRSEVARSEVARSEVAQDQPAGLSGPQPPQAPAGAPAGPAAPAPAAQRLVRTAELELRTPDVEAAAARVRGITAAAKGFVADEQTSTSDSPGDDREDDRPTTPRPAVDQSVLTVRVPTDSLDQVLQQLSQVGTVLRRSQSSQDVTAQHVDTQSRLRSQAASVARVRELLSRATKIGDVVQIEGELARRQADLEALQAQLVALQDRTALSTLTVTLASPAADAGRSAGGFGAGFAAGWAALRSSVQTLLTAVGAVLPFALVAAAVLVPALRWRRRRAGRVAVHPDPVDGVDDPLQR